MSQRLTQLNEAGFDLTPANDSQRGVIEALTDEEMGVLLSVRQRIESAGVDVEGHLAASDPGASGGYLW
jgi:hypothetical protein